jgi:hypothetical protein
MIKKVVASSLNNVKSEVLDVCKINKLSFRISVDDATTVARAEARHKCPERAGLFISSASVKHRAFGPTSCHAEGIYNSRLNLHGSVQNSRLKAVHLPGL